MCGFACPNCCPRRAVFFTSIPIFMFIRIFASFLTKTSRARLSARSTLGTLKWCIDHDFYPKVGLNDDDRSFNSGVLLLDAGIWRQHDIGGQALALGKVHHVHDQTLLNALFSRSFHPLPERYNRILGAEHEPVIASDGVYHFLASPKPWDIWGRYIHRNWHLWHETIVQTQFQPTDYRTKHATDRLYRTWLLRRSYARTLWRALRSKLPSLTASSR